MSEIRLQSDISREFSVRYPKMQGQLFHIPNQRNNKIQAFQSRAIGIIPGASDFLFFEKNKNSTVYNFDEFNIKLIGLEVKEPGSRHSVDHVQRQVDWGKVLEREGGRWFIVTSVDIAMQVIDGNYNGGALSIKDVEEMISNCKIKSLKF